MLGIWPRSEFQAKKTSGWGDQWLSAVKCASPRRRGATAGGRETWETPQKFLPAFVLTFLPFPPSFFFSSPFPASNCLSSNERKACCYSEALRMSRSEAGAQEEPWGVCRWTFLLGSLAGLNQRDLGLGLGFHFRKGQHGQDYCPARQGSWG